MKGDVKPIEFMARREDWSYGVSLYSRQIIEGVKIMAAEPLTFKEADSGSISIANPFMRIDIQQAQQLMDELWQCGLRPSEGTGSAGSLRATESHLSDMRKLVSKCLKTKLE